MVQIPQNVGGNMPDFGFRQKANIQSNTPKISNPFGSAIESAGSLLNVFGKGMENVLKANAEERELLEKKRKEDLAFLEKMRNEENLYKAQNHYQRNSFVVDEAFKQKYQGADASTPEAQNEHRDAYLALRKAYTHGVPIRKEGLLANVDDKFVRVSKENFYAFDKFAENSYTSFFDKQVNYSAEQMKRATEEEYKARVKDSAESIAKSKLNLVTISSNIKNLEELNKRRFQGFSEEVVADVTKQQVSDAVSSALMNSLYEMPDATVRAFFSNYEGYRYIFSFVPEERKKQFIETAKTVLPESYAQEMAERLIAGQPYDDLNKALLNSGLFEEHEKRKVESDLYKKASEMKNVISYNDRESTIRMGNSIYSSVESGQPINPQTERELALFMAFSSNKDDIAKQEASENVEIEVKTETIGFSKSPAVSHFLPIEYDYKKIEKVEKKKLVDAERFGDFSVLKYKLMTEKTDALSFISNPDYKKLSSKQKKELNSMLLQKIAFDNHVETYDKENGVNAFDEKINQIAERMMLTNKKDWEANKKELLAETKLRLMQSVKNNIQDSDIMTTLSEVSLQLLSSSEEDPDRKMLNDLLSSVYQKENRRLIKEGKTESQILWKVIDDSGIKENQKEIVYGYLVVGQKLNALRVLKNGKR